ncbi:MAG TPA: hypothetical protein VFU63_10560, partial [Ktedonobacterales bacterium]|nr:hypothetical protein [Ktedonobacterales bacterium]
MTLHTRHSGSTDKSTLRAVWSDDPQDPESSRHEARINGASGISARRGGRSLIERRGHAAGWGGHYTHTRRSMPHGIEPGDTDTDIDDNTEAEALWIEPWREHHRHNSNVLSPSRDREATVARPIRFDADGRFEDQPEPEDEPDTLVIVPPMRQQVILPPIRSKRPSNPSGIAAIGIVRTLLVSLVLYYVLSSSLQLSGHAALPLAPLPWATTSGTASSVPAGTPLRMDGKVASRVQPMTQMRRVDLYDSRAQFNLWGGSSCSAATLAEILTAYGLPNMTIGRMIREFGRDISPQWGLLTYSAF